MRYQEEAEGLSSIVLLRAGTLERRRLKFEVGLDACERGVRAAKIRCGLGKRKLPT